jgi:hypothetical protein
MSAIYKNAHFWTVVANLNPDTGEYDGDVDGLTEYCDRCHKTRVLRPSLTVYKKSDPKGYYAYLKRKGF